MSTKSLDLKSLLKSSLADATRIAVLGIGSELRADDAAGMLIAQRIEEKCCGKKPKDGADVKVFYGATAPENLTGEIKKFAPSHLVVIDAADTAAKPGTITSIDPDKLLQVSFTTHMMPLKVMVDYLCLDNPCKVVVLGIQPKVLEFGKPVSKEVQKTAKDVADTLNAVLKTT